MNYLKEKRNDWDAIEDIFSARSRSTRHRSSSIYSFREILPLQ